MLQKKKHKKKKKKKKKKKLKRHVLNLFWYNLYVHGSHIQLSNLQDKVFVCRNSCRYTHKSVQFIK